MKNRLTAQTVRVVLLVIMLLIAVGATTGFLTVQKMLTDFATQISRLNADADSGDANIRTLQSVQTKLDQEAAARQAAQSVVADSTTYADTVISNISSVAIESGVTITSLAFVDDGIGSAGTPTTPTTPTTTPTTAPSTAPTGVTKKSVSVSINSPVDYTALMKFIKGIETNKLSMQITSVALTKDQGNLVSSPGFTIEVYVRS